MLHRAAAQPARSPSRARPPFWGSIDSTIGSAVARATRFLPPRFEAYIRDFPKSDQADNAQLFIGKALMFDNKYDKAVEAFEKLIRSYPVADTVAEAYYQEGLSLQHLGQTDKAREAFETATKKYPDTDAALLAKQKLTEAAKPE